MDKTLSLPLFSSLDELYGYIDKNILEFNEPNNDYNVCDYLISHREMFDSNPLQKQNLSWEIQSFMFYFNGTNIFSFATTSDSNSRIIKFPDLKKIETKGFEYLKQRLSEVKSPIISARFCHLLWKAPRGIKHKKYAMQAIQAYTDAIKLYVVALNKSDTFNQHIYETCENLFSLCNEINFHSTDTKLLVHWLLFNVKKLKFYSKHRIINDMLEYPKVFKKNDYENVLSIFEAEKKRKTAKHDTFLWANYYLPTALRIAQKINSNVKKWHNEIGLSYLRIAKSEVQPDRLFIKQDLLVKAIEAFTLSGNKTKKKQAEQSYFELRPKIILEKISIPYQAALIEQYNEILQSIKKDAETFLKQYSAEELYNAIANGLYFPKIDKIKKNVHKDPINLSDIFYTIHFDVNNNIIKKRKNEKFSEYELEAYGMQLYLMTLEFIGQLFITGIKNGKLTAKNFLNYLIKNTWLGKPIVKTEIDGNKYKLNLIALIAPGISEYFIQTQASVSSQYYIPNFTLCIDSLTLKIEGILREFCERLNIPTITSNNKGMQEMFLGDLLNNTKVQNKFSEDDIFFLKFIFLNDGPNIRNKVAHSYYRAENYTHKTMLIVLCALLRVAKFDYKPKN